MRHKIRQYRSLSSTDRRLAWQMAIAVPFVELNLHLFGLNRVIALMCPLFDRNLSIPDNASSEVIRHKNMLKRVCQYRFFKGRCLARSLTLWGLLQRQGIDTELCFGQRYNQGQLVAHAWIEYCGCPVNALQDVHQRYTAFTKPIQLKKTKNYANHLIKQLIIYWS